MAKIMTKNTKRINSSILDSKKRNTNIVLLSFQKEKQDITDKKEKNKYDCVKKTRQRFFQSYNQPTKPL